jgi:hypothetical protein
MGLLFLQQLESKLGPSDWERVWTAPAYIKRRFIDIAAADTAVDAEAFKVFLVPFDSGNSCIESLTSGFKGVTTWLGILYSFLEKMTSTATKVLEDEPQLYRGY